MAKRQLFQLRNEEFRTRAGTPSRLSGVGRKVRRAPILPLADADSPGAWIGREIAQTARGRSGSARNAK